MRRCGRPRSPKAWRRRRSTTGCRLRWTRHGVTTSAARRARNTAVATALHAERLSRSTLLYILQGTLHWALR